MGYLEVERKNGQTDVWPDDSYFSLCKAEAFLGVSRPTIRKHAGLAHLLQRGEAVYRPEDAPYLIRVGDFPKLVDTLAAVINYQTGKPYWSWLVVDPEGVDEGNEKIVINLPEDKGVGTIRTIYNL